MKEFVEELFGCHEGFEGEEKCPDKDHVCEIIEKKSNFQLRFRRERSRERSRER